MKSFAGKRPRSLFAMIAVAAVALVGACSEDSDDLTMPDVTGVTLDIAKSDIERAGYGGDLEIIGGGTFGIIDEGNWTVCTQLPEVGEPIDAEPRLTVERDCGTDEDDVESEEPTEEPKEETTEPEPEPTEEETTEKPEPEPTPEPQPEPSEEVEEPAAESGKSGFNADEVVETYLYHLGPDYESFYDMCGAFGEWDHWGCFYESAENTSSYLRVNLITDGGWSEGDLNLLAENTGRHWFNFIGCDFPDLNTIVVNINGIDHNTYRTDYIDIC
ncbi:PASTA domain-containing protein [Flaviflexus massiliensis]|uniref:PASTA domain-containing protein n=1 Tax=Flaviflexus massiliensis TaxID=1522309 RepID=UPI0006D5797F|nr:PASTA domain-containing protein [Flaviflexus massiliensis]